MFLWLDGSTTIQSLSMECQKPFCKSAPFGLPQVFPPSLDLLKAMPLSGLLQAASEQVASSWL